MTALDPAQHDPGGKLIRLTPSMFDMVREFHRAFGVPAPDAPCLPSRVILDLRSNLIFEELGEYETAVVTGDVTAVADALADLAYVVIGTAVAHGLTQFDAIFAEVHRSNMSKLGADGKPIHRSDGKVLKGPNFTSPNLAPLLKP
jgi:predicted HAD superfamily Cof-like phosphohydrolase